MESPTFVGNALAAHDLQAKDGLIDIMNLITTLSLSSEASQAHVLSTHVAKRYKMAKADPQRHTIFLRQQ